MRAGRAIAHQAPAGTVASVRADPSSRLPVPRRAGGPALSAPGRPAALARPGAGTPDRSARRLWAWWLVSRAVLVTLVVTDQAFGMQQSVLGDLHIYAEWGRGLSRGEGMPTGDDRWQYPPGAAVVFVLPDVTHAYLGLPYRAVFVGMMVAVDAVLTAALVRRSIPAAGFWVAGLTALGPVALARFDLLPAAAAVAAVLALAAGRFGRAGFHLAAGALLKIWPVLLLIALSRPPLRSPGRSASIDPPPDPPPGRPTGRFPAPSPDWLRLAAGVLCAVGGLAALFALTGWWRDAFGFLGAQQARGLQVEAVAATPFVVAHMLGHGTAPGYSYGSLQFDTPLARGVATACSLTEIVVIAISALWWWGWARPPAAADGAGRAGVLVGRTLALLLVVVVTARVLSPQYLVWIMALVAVWIAMARPAGSGGLTVPAGGPAAPVPAGGPSWRWVALLLICVVLSQVVYPWRYNDVVQGRIMMSLVLVVRNVGLVTVCGWAWRAAAGSRPA